MDCRLAVIADADPEAHRVLTTKVFLRPAEIISAEERKTRGSSSSSSG
jgi:hypothetical protein